MGGMAVPRAEIAPLIARPIFGFIASVNARVMAGRARVMAG